MLARNKMWHEKFFNTNAEYWRNKLAEEEPVITKKATRKVQPAKSNQTEVPVADIEMLQPRNVPLSGSRFAPISVDTEDDEEQPGQETDVPMQDVVANAIHAEEETLTAALLSFIDDKYFGEQDEITDKEFKAAQQKVLARQAKKELEAGKKNI